MRDLRGEAKTQADVLPVKAFGLASAVPELARADITRAGARVGSTPLSSLERPSSGSSSSGGASEASAGDEPLFWEWELAVPPESCPYNTGCNSAAVHFVSLAVVGGQLCWLDLKLTSEAAYRNAAGQLRRARTSFTAAPAPPAPPQERGAPQADAAVIVAAP